MKKTPPANAQSSFTVGRAAMEKINAVEGIVLPGRIKEAFASFDRRGLSPEQRRAELRTVFVGKAKR